MHNIKNMTLKQKIGQMFIVREDMLLSNCKDIDKYLEENPIGGIWAVGLANNMTQEIVNFDNQHYADSLAMLKFRSRVKHYNQILDIPLLVGLDAEKGTFMGTSVISGPDQAAVAGEQLAYQRDFALATELKIGGANWRWGPICDIANRENSCSLNRIVSDDPEIIIKTCIAQVKGMQDAGIAATVKHFPGVDPLETRDSHFSGTSIKVDYDEWFKNQGRIYKEVIQSGVYSVMIGHSNFPKVDSSTINGKPRPATFSEIIIKDILKKDFGFDGVVVTDDTHMRACVSLFGRENIDKMFIGLINAGNDMILGSNIIPESINFIEIIEKAVNDGLIAEERINDACSRIIKMKEKLGLFSIDTEEESSLVEKMRLAQQYTKEINYKISEKALTLICDNNKLIPVDKNKIKKVAIISISHFPDFDESLNIMKAEFERRNIEVFLHHGVNYSDARVADLAKNYDLIIYANFISAHKPMGKPSFYGSEMQQFFMVMNSGAEKSIPVSFGSPFIYHDYYTTADIFVNAYWYNEENQITFVKAIFGEAEFTDITPFDIK